jgi:hypothetical protein
MAGRIAYYGNIVTNGLILDLDAAKRDSYPGSGTTWNDISGFQNNGTLTNGPTYSTSGAGSIVFDGVDDYVSTPYTTAIGIGEFSYSIWIKFTISQIGALIVKRLDAPTYQQFSLYIAGDSSGNTPGTKIAFNDVQSTGLLRMGITSTSFNDGKWHHLVATRTSTSTLLYINGTLLLTTTSAAINLSSSSKIFIARSGNDQTVGGIPFNGSIATTQIYNRALTAQEILQNYNATKGRYQ